MTVIGVRLSSTMATDTDLKQLRRLPYLESLALGNMPNLTDAGLSNLEGLTRLEELNLSQNHWVGAGPTDAGLAYVNRLTSLKRLDLSQKRFKSCLPDLGVTT